MKIWILALGFLLPAFSAERATVNGIVTDSDGKPLEQASVLVYSAGVRKGYSIFCPTCWVDCGKRSQTGPDGNYKITGLDPDLVFKLLVVRDGYTAQFVAGVDPEKGPANEAALKPRVTPEDPKQIVRGKVVDVHGKPVRDALVEQQGIIYRVNGQQRRAFGPVDWIDLMAVTNDQGEFEMAFTKPADNMILNVSPRGMASKLFTETTGSERKILTVSDGATIRGRLVRDGKPVAGAEIGISTHSRVAGTTLPEIRVGTREDGTFALTNVPAGRIYYLYGKMNSLADRGLAAELVECETKDDGQEVDLGDIQVKPGYAMRGKVVLSDGKPIPPDMRVNLFHDRASDSQSVMLGEDGRFEFKGLAGGVYQLAPSVRSYQTPEGLVTEVLVKHDVDGVVFTLKPAGPR